MENKARKDMGLDGLTELVLSEDGKRHVTKEGKSVRKTFLGVSLAFVTYDAEYKTSDCPYISKRDGWMEKTGYKGAWLQDLPERATHYVLGNMVKKDESSKVTEMTPVAFFRR